MNAKGRIRLCILAAPGGNPVQDDMNRTVLAVNLSEFGPGPFALPEVAVGDMITVRVPTGELTLYASSVRVEVGADSTYLEGPFTWKGAFAAFLGGKSGLASWGQPRDLSDVTTSAWPEAVPYYTYHRAHNVVREIADPGTLSPKASRALLAQAIQFVLAADVLVKRIRRGAALPCSAPHCDVWQTWLCGIFATLPGGGDEDCPEFQSISVETVE